MPGASDRPQTLHGTAIAMGGKAVLLRGPPGAGKSDLALRCLAVAAPLLLPEPVYLVCDDRAFLSRHGGALIVAVPEQIRGQIEVRGLGIVPVPSQPSARLVLVADLVAGDQPVERMPDPVAIVFEGIAIALMRVHPFEASAALKVLMALRATEGGDGAN